MGNDMLVAQPKLGKAGIIALITAVNMIAPLSTDMYMVALPDMAGYFHTTDTVMNFTLVGFFLFFAVGMILFGPVSDKYGRKPVLMTGIIIYGISCILCGTATDIYFLIMMRVMQALGAGCMVSVTTAMVKDQFTGKAQGTVLSISQIFGVLGPVIAPLLGAQIYRLFGWRATFFTLAAVSVLFVAASLLLAETLKEDKRTDKKVLSTFGGLTEVIAIRRFTMFLAGMAMLQLPMMAYLSASSYIYQNQFGLTATGYSLYFAATALMSGLGPWIYLLLRRKETNYVSYGVFAVVLTAGMVIMAVGHRDPAFFAAGFAPVMMMISFSRPFATTILLNMIEKNAGSAAAVINFTFTFTGAIGMFVITALWSDYITGVAMIAMGAAAAGTLILTLLMTKEGTDALRTDIS